MEEGFYWIQHSGISEIAYFTNEIFQDVRTGSDVIGVWSLTRSDDICHDEEVEILAGPLRYPD
ncbi:hypothetical protein MUW95_20480 [Klebsiella aerogenes]|uniref:hypothetical protein n=1 Tax=Klebsiella aerogenes TaxID=548 RepID=UPI0011170B7B|nr:hypothetical protein [Klebsiella aerogenes]MCL9944175.1 hypothetical protein [Klebsiella aerogenes]HBQ1809753.1 hypothetical protein [Klebsiella aerogenes]HCM7224788.1 hypothetical protein [Klebsiella aerogenes]HED2522052.1 hypothetical protein [Klebsiella aerogenes]